jgi:crossover junction endodeoxyribonuclease RuvC
MKRGLITYLGVDPGIINTGWGIISKEQNKLSFVAEGVIIVDSKISIEKRLSKIYYDLSQVVSLYNPDECAIEDIFVNNNNLSSLKLGYARAAAILTIGLAQKSFFEYAPNLVKKSIVGKGKATKEQVQYMVNQILPKAKVTNEHAADALAVAICHANYSNLRME